MNFNQVNRTSPEKGVMIVKNGESSSAFTVGGPVNFSMDATDDGLDCELVSTGGAAKGTTLLAGMAMKPTAAGEWGPVQVYGFCSQVKLVRITRAATTDSFATRAAIALGDKLQVLAANDAVSRLGAGAVSDMQVGIAAAETRASSVGAASTTSDATLLKTENIKAFLRLV